MPRSLQELKQLLIECYDTDNLEQARAKFQSQLTDEELKMLRDRQQERKDAYANVEKEFKIGLIDGGEYYKRVEALNQKYAEEMV